MAADPSKLADKGSQLIEGVPPLLTARPSSCDPDSAERPLGRGDRCETDSLVSEAEGVEPLSKGASAPGSFLLSALFRRVNFDQIRSSPVCLLGERGWDVVEERVLAIEFGASSPRRRSILSDTGA